MKPEKFQVRQEIMMTSACMRGMLSLSLLLGFSGPHGGEADTAPRFSV